MTIELTVGDTAPTLEGTINAVGTGATAEAHIKRPDDTVIEREADVDAEGAWTCELEEDDLTIAGVYYVEVEVLFSNGKVQSFARNAGGFLERFVVREQYA